MNSYSHLVLAKQLEPYLKPEYSGEFLWGAVVPDIRYLTGMPRNQTHLSRDKIKLALSRYPHLRSFILGYLVHCLLDELDLSRIIGRKFPISVLRTKLSQQKIAVLVELYYQEFVRIDLDIQGTQNNFMFDLGIDQGHIETFASLLNQYLSDPSVKSMVAVFQNLGFFEDSRIQKYIRAAESLDRNWLVKNLLFLSVKRARINQIATSHVLSSLTEFDIVTQDMEPRGFIEKH